MRILFITRDLVPGNGDNNYTFRLEEILKSHGHEVAYFCSGDARNLESQYADYFVEPVVYGELINKKKPWNILRTAIRTVYSSEVKTKLEALLRYFKPDIVHVQHLHTHIQPSILPHIKKHNIPIVYTLNVYTPLCVNHMLVNRRTSSVCESCFPDRFYRIVTNRCVKGGLAASILGAVFQYVNHARRYYDCIDSFICPSLFVQHKFAACGFYPEKLHHLPYFLDTSAIAPRFDSDGYGLFFGRLVPEKGVDVILQSLEGTGIPFKVVGSGESYHALVSTSRRLGLDNLEFTGFKSGDELRSLIQGARFVVVPSRWHEVFGIVILEAFACGKPVIGSRMGGIAEVIRDGETGYLFDPEQVTMLREQMLTLNSPAAATTMGRNARDYVERNYSPNTHYDNLYKIYASIKRNKNSVIQQ